MGLFTGLAITVCTKLLCVVDRASLYILVNKANLVHNLFLVYLFSYQTVIHTD